MMMKVLKLVALAGAAMAAAAPAATVYQNDFDAENGGNTQLNYSGFTGLTVTSGTVDIIRQPDFGLGCAGGAGSCVDLDGSTANGGELQTGFYAFNAGDLVTFSFDLSGSQRGDAANPFDAGFRFSTPTNVAQFTTGGGYGDSTSFNNGVLTQTVYGGTSQSGDPYATFTLSFRASNAGSVAAYIGTSSNDSIGPVLDNVSLAVAAVPEPATWAMMIGGIGAAGGALRRRRSSGTRAALA